MQRLTTHFVNIYKLLPGLICLLFIASCAPKEPIVLREIKDVVADASSEPRLKAQAVFYNPNKMRMKLRKIKVDIFIDGQKRGEIDQEMRTLIPSQSEFTIPLEVKLSMKELGLLNTLFGMIGGKKMDVEYKGSLKLNYKGIPVNIPVDYKSEIRLKI